MNYSKVSISNYGLNDNRQLETYKFLKCKLTNFSNGKKTAGNFGK